ncbi:hypothetical protein D3C72_1562010 [compost metagenome]
MSCSQLDTLPPGTRLMVTEKLYGTDGELEMVYERMIGWPSISSSRVTNCPGLKKNRIGWSAMKQKVRTSQVSWMTLTQRTMCRPLAQVWVVTGFRKLLDMLISTADCRPHVGDSAYSANRPFTYPRHRHTYRDQPATTGGCASGTDCTMSPMDKVRGSAGSTLAPTPIQILYTLRSNR